MNMDLSSPNYPSLAALDGEETGPTLEFSDKDLFSGSTMEFQPKELTDLLCEKLLCEKLKLLHLTPNPSTLKINLGSGLIPDPFVEEFIRIALKNNLRTLDLYVPEYILGEIVFLGESLVNINLNQCQLRTLSVDQIRCHNIRTLGFYMVSMGELMFENIVCGCPLLELLKISYCRGAEEGGNSDCDELFLLQVKNHASLRQVDVELYSYQKLILGELPRLESLICANDENYLGQLEDMWEDDDWMPCGFSLHSCQYQNMKTLVLCAVGIGDNFFDNFTVMFPYVEDLSIQYCQDLRIVKISSHLMKRIQLVENRRLKEAQFDVPMLARFEYRSEAELIPLLSFSAVSGVSGGWVSFLDIDYRYNVPNLWFLKLKELFSGLVQSEILLRIGFATIPAFNMDEIRNFFAYSEPLMVEELSVYFRGKELSILDALFWIFRPKIICQPLADRLEKNVFMRFLYEILVRKNNEDQTRFWQAYLKDVEVGSVEVERFKSGLCRTWRCRDYRIFDMGHNALDWQGFLDVSRTILMDRIMCFKFEWITSEMHQALDAQGLEVSVSSGC